MARAKRCKLCGFTTEVKLTEKQKAALHVGYCSEHKRAVCPACGGCPSVRATAKVKLRAIMRTALILRTVLKGVADGKRNR